MGRDGDAEVDIAPVVAFLLSDDVPLRQRRDDHGRRRRADARLDPEAPGEVLAAAADLLGALHRRHRAARPRAARELAERHHRRRSVWARPSARTTGT